MTTDQQAPDVLVVEDDRGVADLYAAWLDGEYAVRTAYSGAEALERMDDTIAAVALDRRLPAMTGDEVLDELRARGYDCPVVMVTAVDPDVELVELPCEGYLLKPVTRSDLVQMVAGLTALEERKPVVREFVALATKQRVLEAELNTTVRTASEAYERLQERLAHLEKAVDREMVPAPFEDLLDTGSVTGVPVASSD